MKKAIVAGCGISGIGSTVLLLNHNYSVTIFDENTNQTKEEIYNKIVNSEDLASSDVSLTVVTGDASRIDLNGQEMCVLSPGINPDNTFVRNFENAGIPCISEIELAYLFGKGRIAAITGTNGKTTTTSLLGHIMKEAGYDSHIAGNIGKAYTGIADKLTSESISVIEIAGFQLQTIDKFHPEVSAILNITPDHLDRFITMDAYAKAKERIVKNQTPDDVCVLNYEDERLRKFAKNIAPRVLFFSSAHELDEGAFLRNEYIVLRIDGKEELFMRLADMKLIGIHNYENVMAALLMALSLGVDKKQIRKSIISFKPVEHRIEFVIERDGVMYYNDSKGTNPDAAIQAIKAMNRPTIVIGGGYDKHVEFDEWIKACKKRARFMVLIGESAKQIAQTADKYGFKDYAIADTLEDAVDMAKSKAKSGDAVLLSPACASWDMFPNYEVRGKRFKELVR